MSNHLFPQSLPRYPILNYHQTSPSRRPTSKPDPSASASAAPDSRSSTSSPELNKNFPSRLTKTPSRFVPLPKDGSRSLWDQRVSQSEKVECGAFEVARSVSLPTSSVARESLPSMSALLMDNSSGRCVHGISGHIWRRLSSSGRLSGYRD